MSVANRVHRRDRVFVIYLSGRFEIDDPVRTLSQGLLQGAGQLGRRNFF